MAENLTKLLGIRHPILLAGMAGGPTTPELVGAVSRGGGLGVLGVNSMTVDAARAAVRASRELAGGGPPELPEQSDIMDGSFKPADPE